MTSARTERRGDRRGGGGRLAPPTGIRAGIGWGLPLVVGLVHVALIAPHYFVGSFDDDASYIMTAKALASGAGLTGHVASGAPVVGLYPPGYSALLVPLVLLWPHTFAPLRIFSAVCVAALFALLWVYLGRKGISGIARSITLLLLALTPVLATYGSMVMAEAPYLVLFMAVLLLVDRWDRQERVWTVAGVGVIVASAALVWVKSAGIGAVLGLVLYLVGHRGARAEIKIRRAALLMAGVALSLVPLLLARKATDTPLLGSRYASELGAYYAGGFLSRLVHVVPASALHLVGIAIPDTIAPYRSPLPASPFLMNIAWQAFAVQMMVVMAIGALWWWRRNHDAATAVVLVYLLETIFWPEVNERRVILVIPILVSWYVLGGVAIIDFVRQRRTAGRLWPSRTTIFAAGGIAGVTVAMLIPQLPHDYLFALGQDTSHFGGSRYVSLLSHLGPPSDVSETDYLSSGALFTGHRTGWSAFAPSGGTDCSFAGITQDAAAYMLLGDVNQSGVLDSPCLLHLASTSPWAVELLHTSRDNATVFELIGPGTGHPDLIDLTRSATETVSHDGDRTIVEWNWSTLRPVDQVSVGEASLSGAHRISSDLELLTPAGTWKVVASAGAAVGDGAGDAPYLLAANLGGKPAAAVRVVVNGSSPAGVADVEDVAALGG